MDDSNHRAYILGMRRALERAEEALNAGEAPVGAVVLRHGHILADAREMVVAENDPAGHAELRVLREACRLTGSLTLPDCTLCTTVEPCILCAFALRAVGIARVIIGVPIAGIGGATSAYPILTASNIPDFSEPPQLIWGVLEAECADLLRRRLLRLSQVDTPRS